MGVIDLSMELYSGMPVFPGDPDVKIEPIFHYEIDQWNMRRIEMNTHDATHVNVPIHATKNGKTLDNYSLDNFIGEAVKYECDDDIIAWVGLIFDTIDINSEIAERIVRVRPKFIALPARFEFDLEIERDLLEAGIISFERLVNTEKLPKRFFFHGAPLNIKEGDGSPVRAYAIF